jgi:hypothetical protein
MLLSSESLAVSASSSDGPGDGVMQQVKLAANALAVLLVGAVEALPLEIMVSSRMCSFIRASMVVSCALSFEIVGLQRQSAKQQCAVACSLFDL